MIARVTITLLLLLSSEPASARVDTLRGTANIADATLYGFPNCDPELQSEDCRRFNTGSVPRLRVGSSEIDDHRAVMRFPGLGSQMPDSAVLMLYCTDEADTENRRLFIYPLTRRFFEGAELRLAIGDYPSPDSGVTWNHAFLDTGDRDSLRWTTPGGDFTTAVACTLTVTGSGSYQRAAHFDRLIEWWDTTGHDPGIILINENAFPANTAIKYFGSTEDIATHAPILILYYPDGPGIWTRRRLQSLSASDN